jgi:hypothetical protein
MKFYDTGLSPNVRFAYHAISIDECRSSFERVEWGSKGAASDLEQIWFAGNHADVGGGYPENESRLSDIALLWMLHKGKDAGLTCDDSVLHLHQDAAGLQHDETRSDWKFRLASRLMGDKPRRPDQSAPVHPTVLERFALADGVIQFDVARPYRPLCLRNNTFVRHFYDADQLTEEFKESADKEAARRAAEPGSSAEVERWLKAKLEIERRATALNRAKRNPSRSGSR